MDVLKKLQLLQRRIREDDEMIGEMIEALMAQQEGEANREDIPARSGAGSARNRGEMYPLGMAAQICTGRKPRELVFPDGHRIPSPSWKKVFLLVLKDCNEDPQHHAALMEMRGNLMGRSRVLLDGKRGNMRSPAQIDRALFVETHYDAGTLLRVLTRILDELGCDYSGIRVTLQNG